jgi:hypothetical protein
MKLLEQFSYRSNQVWRPQATILTEESLNLWGVCFSWGEMELSEKIIENVRFFVDACHNQSEITNPFGYEVCLSGLENALRSGYALANDVIYRLVNKGSITGGAECAFVAKRGQEVAIAQVGQPHVFLKRRGQVLPLSTTVDLLPSDFLSGSYLPSRLLGLHDRCYPHLQSFQYEKGDELIFLAHSFVPTAVLQSTRSNPKIELKALYQQIAKEMPQCPFWISTIKL